MILRNNKNEKWFININISNSYLELEFTADPFFQLPRQLLSYFFVNVFLCHLLFAFLCSKHYKLAVVQQQGFYLPSKTYEIADFFSMHISSILSSSGQFLEIFLSEFGAIVKDISELRLR